MIDPISRYAVSDDSNSLSNYRNKIAEFNSKSFTLGWKQNLTNDLKALYNSCLELDYELDEELPIPKSTLISSIALIDALPENIVVPEILAEPEGNIAFVWQTENREVYFIISVRPNTLIFAGLIGFDKIQGTQNFSGYISKQISTVLLDYFQN